MMYNSKIVQFDKLNSIVVDKSVRVNKQQMDYTGKELILFYEVKGGDATVTVF